MSIDIEGTLALTPDDQAAGNASPSMAQKLLQEMEDRHPGAEMHEIQKNIAIDATGMGYAGMSLLLIPPLVADASMTAAVDTVSITSFNK